MKKISFIIPVWNEEATLESLVERVLSVELPSGFEKEIILINDGSKDRSPEIIDNLAKKYKEVKNFHNEKNSGKTQTVKNGIAKSTGDYIIMQDADLEYDPNEIVDLINLLNEKNLDVVYGDRFGKKNKVVYWQNYAGNKFLSLLSNFFTYPRIKVWLPDMEVCYKLIRGDVAREIGQTIESRSKFGLEPEITAKLSKYKIGGKHLRFGVVPVSYFPRTMAEGKKMNALPDGLKAIREVFVYNL